MRQWQGDKAFLGITSKSETMVKQLAGRMLILGAKRGSTGYLLRLWIKLKHLSIQFRKSELK